jgi:dolichyl-phosphate beta-glucosyltransferase
MNDDTRRNQREKPGTRAPVTPVETTSLEANIGIVIPLFNEASRWDAERWLTFVNGFKAEWLFVDDGSTDGSRNLVQALMDSHPNVYLKVLASNQGKAEAVRLGLLELLEHSNLEIVGYLDADGAFSLLDITRISESLQMPEKKNQFDAVWSSRVALAGHQIERSTLRHYLGRGVATLIGSSLKPMPYDTQSGFKMFRASPELASCMARPFSTRWLFDVEIILRWKVMNDRPIRIIEIPVTSWRDVPGSKIKGREVLRITRELLRIMRQTRLHND